MKQISDEKLMSYVDGELSPAEELQIAHAMSPELALRALAFRKTGRRLAVAYEGVHAAPQGLTESILSGVLGTPRQEARVLSWPATARQTAGTQRTVVNFREYLASFKEWLAPPRWGLVAMPALSLGLVIGAASVWLGTPPQELAALSLQQALENNPTGTATPAVRPTSTFERKGGGWCREYVLTEAADRRSTGVACREKGGHWETKAQAALTGRPPVGEKRSRPAGDRTGEHPPEVEAVAAALSKDVPIDVKQEPDLIRNGWPTAR
jgi:hypothetical protein